MLVLGIDPGTYHMGVGAVDVDGDEYTLTLSDALSPPRKSDLADRLGWLHRHLDAIVADLRPDVIAIEAPFMARNVKAAIAVGQAQAVAMIVASAYAVPVASYTPRDVKKSITDYGGSSKQQVQEMIQVLLGLPDPLESSDRADALAVAICHVNSTRMDDIEMWE